MGMWREKLNTRGVWEERGEEGIEGGGESRILYYGQDTRCEICLDKEYWILEVQGRNLVHVTFESSWNCFGIFTLLIPHYFSLSHISFLLLSRFKRQIYNQFFLINRPVAVAARPTVWPGGQGMWYRRYTSGMAKLGTAVPPGETRGNFWGTAKSFRDFFYHNNG